MPRETTPKSFPGGPKPYPPPLSLSKTQLERIATALVTALASINEPPSQTTYSEDEDADDEAHDNTSPVTLSSSSSSAESLRNTITPFEEKIQKSSETLRKLHDLLSTCVSSGNQEALTKCSKLILHHKSIVTESEAAIATAKEAWTAQEQAKTLRLEASKVKKATKSKGKNPAPPSAEEEFQELQNMLEPAPEGSPLSRRAAPTTPNYDPELATLEYMLDLSAHPRSTQSTAPADRSLRFPTNRTLPPGFNYSRLPTASPPHPASSSNPFAATPLHVPEEFSPSKVQGAKAPSPIQTVATRKPRKAKASTSGTRTSNRSKPQQSYTEKNEQDEEYA